jgi:Domain of unknown function (DUF4410)
MNSYIRFIVPMVAVALTACGTTSDIKPDAAPAATGGVATQNVKLTVDLSGYDKVVVLDFADATDTSKLKPDQLRAHNEMMAADLHQFSDLIARSVRDTGAYSEVVREPGPGKALVISGRVTRLVEGNSTLRLLIGMGAGSSYFDAEVKLSDSETGNTLGSATTGNNSWPLGGMLASGQTVQGFLELSAIKIANRLRDGKKSHVAAGGSPVSAAAPRQAP